VRFKKTVEQDDTGDHTMRVVHRLKEWFGQFDIGLPFFSGEHNGPHLTALCEGCKWRSNGETMNRTYLDEIDKQKKQHWKDFLDDPDSI
jgi:hypothetical protein